MKEVKRRRKQRSDIYERWAGHRARVVKRWKRCLQVRREISLKTIIDCFLWDHVSLGEWKQQFCCKKLLSMESSHNKERDYNISLLVSMTRVPIRLHKSRSTIADAFFTYERFTDNTSLFWRLLQCAQSNSLFAECNYPMKFKHIFVKVIIWYKT